MSTPVLLSDVLASLPAGESRAFTDPTKFQSPFRSGMWLDEVRVSYTNLKDSGGDIDIGPADLGVKLVMGDYRITNDFVPAWTLGKLLTSSECNAAKPVFVWRLRHPLYVAPKAWIQPEVRHTDTYRGAAEAGRAYANVRVSLVGRTYPESMPPPARPWRPWVTSWSGIVRSTAADFTDRTSGPSLFNPNQNPLLVERFNARFPGDGLDSMSTLTALFEVHQQATKTLVRAFDSDGKILVRDPTPFDLLFTTSERSWRVQSYLKPKGFFLFSLTEDFAGFTGDFRYAPQITMVGYHREP